MMCQKYKVLYYSYYSGLKYGGKKFKKIIRWINKVETHGSDDEKM